MLKLVSIRTPGAICLLLPPAWYTDTMAPLKGGGGLPKYVTKVPSAKLGVMIPESLTRQHQENS